MGERRVESFDPTPKSIQPLQNSAAAFLQAFIGGGGVNPATNPFLQMAQQGPQQGGLSQQAGRQLSMLMSGPSPEQQALQQISPALQGILNQSELRNPFGDMGAFNQGQQVVGAAQPIFQRNLQRANTELFNRVPGRFSSAAVREGTDLNSQALQDFNLFQQQALMQGLGLQNQQQQAALNFMLGARGLQQQGALGAGGLLGQLAGQAGGAQRGLALGAGQLGLGQDQLSQQAFGQNVVNPTLQLLLGALGFGQPMPQEAVVKPSTLEQIGNVAGGVGSLLMPLAFFRNSGGGSS